MTVSRHHQTFGPVVAFLVASAMDAEHPRGIPSGHDRSQPIQRVAVPQLMPKSTPSRRDSRCAESQTADQIPIDQDTHDGSPSTGAHDSSSARERIFFIRSSTTPASPAVRSFEDASDAGSAMSARVAVQ